MVDYEDEELSGYLPPEEEEENAVKDSFPYNFKRTEDYLES